MFRRDLHAIVHAIRRCVAGTRRDAGHRGNAVMRTAWWACTFIFVLTCSVAYQLSSQPLLLDRPSGVSARSERPPLDQKSDRPLVHNDEARLQDVPSAP